MDGSGMMDRIDQAVLSPGISLEGATHSRETDPLTVTKRLQRDGHWAEVEPLRNQIMKETRKQGMSKKEAQAWTYSELDRLYPPLQPIKQEVEEVQTVQSTDSGQIRGPSTIPDDWPELTGNASLQAEISRVQANRLAVVHEKPSGETVVDLDQARTPAPSWAALV